MSETAIDRLAELLTDARDAVALTGAGISTESGIPDFRSPQTGLYATIDPMEYLSVDALNTRPEQFWKYFVEIFVLPEAEPNAGHMALAWLEENGYLSAIITQNIDGLHHKAGSQLVFEIHGHLRTVHCTVCERTWPMEEAVSQVQAGKLPSCGECGAALRPDVVLFGDQMPAAFQEAFNATQSADLVMVVGSSLSVSPANMLAFQGNRLAIVNRDPTAADNEAALAIHASAGQTLTALVEKLTTAAI